MKSKAFFSGTKEQLAEDTLWSGTHYEFDILLPNKGKTKGTKAQIRGGRWTNGIVPYVISNGHFGE